MARPGPTMTREDSHRRAERAYRLRCVGRTWQEIADAEGFRSRRAAQLAVQRYLAHELPERAEQARRSAADGLRIVRAVLFTSLVDAKQSGDHQAVVNTARALTDNIDRHAKLLGLHAPQQVDITVRQSAAAILSRAEADLLALAAGQPSQLAVLDAEVVSEAAG
jgi:hypothetical protein